MKIAVLGAFGQMGEACLYDLGQSSSVKQVIAADLHVSRAKTVLARLPNRSKFKVLSLDMKSPEAKKKLAGVDVVVNCAWYELNLAGMDLALAIGAHYVDLGGLFHMTLKQLKRFSEFKKAGKTAVVGCGSTPGITNMMAERLTRGMERIDTLGVYDISQEPAAAEGSFLPPFSIRTMLDEYEMQAPVLLNGKLKFLPACSLDEELVFPKPFGRAVATAVIHSELATLPESYKDRGLKNCWFKIVYPKSVRDQLALLVGMGFSSDRPIRINGGSGVSPRSYLTAMALKGIADSGSSQTPKDQEVLRVTAEGLAGGERVSLQLDCLMKAAFGLSAGAMGVGFPASIAAQLAAAGRTPAGVFGPERSLPVDEFFEQLLKRKIFKLEYSLKKPVS